MSERGGAGTHATALQSRFRRLHWVAAAAVLALLAWQGHHLAAALPALEHGIEALGPWGPVAFIAAALVLGPLMVPDTIFGVTAGVVFGLAAGSGYYCAASYGASLIAYFAGRRWLRRPVLKALEGRASLGAAVRAVRSEGVRLVFWLRLIPMSPAGVGYALGAADVPFRAVAVGSLGMLPHLFLTVYVGATAAHVTRMAARGHADWRLDGLALGMGLVACGVLLFQVTRIARRELRIAEGAVEPAAS